MENEKIRRGRGRPKIFTAEELRKKKTALMLNKKWYCDVCNNNKNYTLAGKTQHLRTNMHQLNMEIKK